MPESVDPTHHVEEGEVLLLLDDLAELFPLLLADVDTARVVSACVKAVRAAGHRGGEGEGGRSERKYGSKRDEEMTIHDQF